MQAAFVERLDKLPKGEVLPKTIMYVLALHETNNAVGLTKRDLLSRLQAISPKHFKKTDTTDINRVLYSLLRDKKVYECGKQGAAPLWALEQSKDPKQLADEDENEEEEEEKAGGSAVTIVVLDMDTVGECTRELHECLCRAGRPAAGEPKIMVCGFKSVVTATPPAHAIVKMEEDGKASVAGAATGVTKPADISSGPYDSELYGCSSRDELEVNLIAKCGALVAMPHKERIRIVVVSAHRKFALLETLTGCQVVNELTYASSWDQLRPFVE